MWVRHRGEEKGRTYGRVRTRGNNRIFAEYSLLRPRTVVTQEKQRDHGKNVVLGPNNLPALREPCTNNVSFVFSHGHPLVFPKRAEAD